MKSKWIFYKGVNIFCTDYSGFKNDAADEPFSTACYSESFVSGRVISSLCSLALKVLGWMPRIAAAPSFPSMRHLVSVRIFII